MNQHDLTHSLFKNLQIYTTAMSKVNNMEYYDVAFLAKITLDNLLVLISTYTGLDKNQVVSDIEAIILPTNSMSDVRSRSVVIDLVVRF